MFHEDFKLNTCHLNDYLALVEIEREEKKGGRGEREERTREGREKI